MNKTVISLLTLITFLPYYCIITGTWPLFHLTTTNLSILLFYVIYSIILVTILYLIHGKNIPANLGLDKNIIKAILYGTICVLPMLVYSIICGSCDSFGNSHSYIL
jgi:hypothetical protein